MTDAPLRVLVTGSRSWPYRETLNRALEAQEALYPDRKLVLIHGDCPTGADAMADEWGRSRGPDSRWVIEKYPAQWNLHGRAAGPLRNQEMVDKGADICLAFPEENSRGTKDCMARALGAGIPVENYGHIF